MRESTLERITSETNIQIKLNIDGKGDCDSNTGIGFLDHMMVLFAKHGSFDLDIKCKGDLWVDNHHTVEDMGILLGTAFKDALGDKKMITRYGTFYCPMDEALTRINVDLSGRGYLIYNVTLNQEKVGTLDTQTLKEFFYSFAINAGMNLHITNLYGENCHHIIESIFKGMSRALKEACSIDKTTQGIPSTKGVL